MTTPLLELPSLFPPTLLSIFTECSKPLHSSPPVCFLLHLLLPLDQTLHNRLSITSLHCLQHLGPVLLLCSSSKSPVFQNPCSPGLQRWLEKIHGWEVLSFQRHGFSSQTNPQVCSDTLLPAQISSLSLVTIVMCPTLSLNSLPNSIFTLAMCFASFHKENRCESSRSIPNESVSILTLPSLDLSSEVNSSTFLCFRAYPATLILFFSGSSLSFLSDFRL